MLSSRIFRNPQPGALKRVQFRDFDTTEGAGGMAVEASDFVPGSRARAAQIPEPSATAPAEPPVDVEAIRAQAFAEGRQAGLQEAQERFGQAADALAQGVEEVSRLRQSLLGNSSADMLRLVMTIARQVVQAEVSVRGDLVLKTIERALHAAVQADSHVIRVNPADLALVTERKPLFLASVNGLKNIAFEPDPQIGRGGCRLDSEFGEVDATIEGQLEEIQRTLERAVEGG